MSAVFCGGVQSTTVQRLGLGNPEPWEPLLDRGACPQAHTVGTGETPLHLAARFSRPTAARRLLEAGANPNQPDRAGRTPLHTAVAADAREVCQEQTPLFLAAREGAVEVAQLLLELGAARGLRDQAGLAPADVARQRSHWDLLTLLEGAGPTTQEARAHARNTPGGGAAPRCRTMSAGARPRGGGACLQARAWSVDLGARRGAVYARCRSRSGGSGGPSMRGRRLSADSRGRRGARVSQDDWPRDWVTLEACGSACSAPIPPPSLTPSPERGSPQVAWGLPVHQEVPLNSGGRNQN